MGEFGGEIGVLGVKKGEFGQFGLENWDFGEKLG